MVFKLKSKLVPGVKPKQFRKRGRDHRKVRIYIVGENKGDLENVESVQYELHPTFRERFRVSVDQNRNFAIRIWTYGFFKAKAKISLKNGTVETTEGFIRWET